LLLQGIAATYLHWGGRLLSLLAESFEVVAYHHRGVGCSMPVLGPFTMADLADDAAALLDELGWTSAHIAGVSMGGVVAQELALRHPDRVESLFLGCTHTGGDDSPTVISDGAAAAVVHGNALATARNLFRLGVKDLHKVRPVAWEEYRHAALTLPVHPRTTVLQIGAVAAHSTADRLHRIAVPTRIVHGDADRFVPLDAGARVAAAIPDARFTVLSAGHFFWLEQPERTVELVRELALRQENVRPDLGTTMVV
jgi:3-oxoadipate enol-lactonase